MTEAHVLQTSPVRAWVLAARPPTLSAAVVPVAVGTATAHVAGGVRPGPAMAALAGALLIQIGTNFVNDVADHDRGADTEARLGPTRAVQAGLLTARQVRAGATVAFALAFAIGVYLVAVGGWPVVLVGLGSIAAGIAYTAGPFPLGYHGLGEPFVMLFFGPVAVATTAYVQLGTVPDLAWWCAVPVGSLTTAILVVNNVRDRDTDAVAGKRTLAVRFGRTAGVVEYGALLAIAYAVPVVVVAGQLAGAAALLPLATAPWAVRRVARVACDDGPALNGSLAATAQLLLSFGLLLAAGLVLGGGR